MCTIERLRVALAMTDKQMMPEPKVVHCKRDVSLPNTVYVGRPTKWGNPFVMKTEADRKEVIKQYILSNPPLIKDAKVELKGKNLSCWCAPKACHADVLLEIADSD